MSIDPRVGIALIVVCVLTFILVERDRLSAAGLVGALATASRPTGMALIAGLLALTLFHVTAFFCF